MSEPVSFGSLEQVPLRTAWTHEAHGFTPWLAQNIDRLSAAIGIPLEVTGTEVAVESFSADILARNPQDDSVVLIENQLEDGDHKHLGQIMTYLAGLSAHTVVWIAPDFREPHRSAIRWLNEHTVDPYSFFAVRVRVVRIGDSPLAPVFEVLERPNDWERRLQEVARESRDITELGAFRREFWTHFTRRHPEEARRGPVEATSVRWRAIDPYGIVISQYLAQQSVGVFVRPGRGAPKEVAAELLAPFRDELEKELGARFESGSYGHLFSKKLSIDTRDKANWDRMSDWLVAEADEYEKALRRALSRRKSAGETDDA